MTATQPAPTPSPLGPLARYEKNLIDRITVRGFPQLPEAVDLDGEETDRTLVAPREGKRLIEVCAAELGAVGAALEELRLDELVSRLEREAGT